MPKNKSSKITDKVRLDWLEQTESDIMHIISKEFSGYCVGPDQCYFEVSGKSLRQAIDTAIRGTNLNDK